MQKPSSLETFLMLGRGKERGEEGNEQQGEWTHLQ